MRAKFVNEKFKEESDPIKDMGIGYSEKMLNTISWRVLKFIESKGNEGARLTDIQHYIYVNLTGHSEKDFWKKERAYLRGSFVRMPNAIRQTRGWWSDQLYGTYNQAGLLHKYCKKNPITHRWVLVKMPRPNENFFSK